MKARLMDSSEHDVSYGILRVENVSVIEVQKMISKIKREFLDEGFDDWTIDDILKRFPDTWNWNFECSTDVLTI